MVVAVQITKEQKRIEAAIEKNMEKLHKANSDATSVAHKDALMAIEKMLKKEIAAVVPTVGHAVTPMVEKAISTAFQEALRLSMEASVVPAFDKSCKIMFEQVDATFQKGMVEHTNAVQQKVESTCSPLAIALTDAIHSASSMTQILNSELADGGRRMMALAVGGVGSIQANPLISNRPSGGFHEKVEASVDPTRELSRLLNEHKYQEAFTAALQRSDVRIVSWLCSQVGLHGILASNPLPLTQVVLLSLL
ncbi:hypothetical protein Tco_0503276 [Tanacetum coccineum]